MGNNHSSHSEFLQANFNLWKKSTTESSGSLQIYRRKSNIEEAVVLVQKTIHRQMYAEIRSELLFMAKQLDPQLFLKIHTEGCSFNNQQLKQASFCDQINPNLHQLQFVLQYQSESLKSFMERRNGVLSFEEIKLILNKAVEAMKFIEQKKFQLICLRLELQKIYITPEGGIKFSPIESKVMYTQSRESLLSCTSSLDASDACEIDFMRAIEQKSPLGQLKELCQRIMPNSLNRTEMEFKAKFLRLKTPYFESVLPPSDTANLMMLFPKRNDLGKISLGPIDIRSCLESNSLMKTARTCDTSENSQRSDLFLLGDGKGDDWFLQSKSVSSKKAPSTGNSL